MSNQIQITGGAKVRNLDGVITGSTGVLNSLPINAANGIPQLDSNGKILVSQLPNSVMEYKGMWNVATNTPYLVNGTGNAGDVYLVTGAASGGTSHDFGAGPITFYNSDQVIYDGTNWDRASGSSGTVTSVGLTMPSAFSVSGSPVTNSGTLAVSALGTTSQYINGAGGLTTFPSLTGFVPYTGATNDLNLGSHNFYGVNYFDGFSSITASSTPIVLTINSNPSYLITGSGGQTIKLPDATTLPNGAEYFFNNNQSSGTISVNNNSNTLVKSVPSGGYLVLTLLDNSSAAGSWDAHFQAPSNVSWSTNTFDYSGSFTSGTWNGNVIGVNRGGTGQSSFTDGQLLIGNSTGNTLTKATLSSGAGISITNGSGSISIASTITQYTDAMARNALSFTAGSGGYNSTTGVITIPTNNNQISNGSNFITLTSLSGGAGISYNGATGVITSTITQYTDALARLALSANSPLLYNNTTGVFSIQNATSTQNGYLSSGDWITFNSKQNLVGLTVTGNSGSATFNSSTGALNIPTYTLAGLGGISLTSLSATTPLSYNNITGVFSIQQASATQSGYLSSTDWSNFNSKQSALTFSSPLVNTAGVITITKSDATHDGYLSSTDWNTFNGKQTALSGTGFVKISGTTISYDNSTYYLASNPSGYISGNQTITLSGDVSGSGTTAITTTIGAGKVTNAMLAGSIDYAKMNSATVPTWNQNTTGTAANITATSNSTIITLSALSLPYSQLTGTPSLNYLPLAGGTLTGDLSLNSGTLSALKFNTGSADRLYISSTVTQSVFNSLTTNPIRLQINGTTYLNIASSGNIQINGTTDAGYTLDVNGTGRFTDNLNLSANTARVIATDSTGRLVLQNSGGTTYGIFYGASNATPNVTTFVNNSALTLTLNANNTATFSSSVTAASGIFAQSGGYVGTFNNTTATNGVTRLQFNSNDAASTNRAGELNWRHDLGSGTLSGFYFQGIGYGGTSITGLAITQNGVGIGTTSPNYTASGRTVVALDGSSSSLYALQNSGTSAGYLYGDGGNVIVWAEGNRNLTMGNAGSGALLFNSNNTERMRITSGGNVLIGTTTDNGQGTLQNPGSVFLGGIQFGGLTFSTSRTATTSTVLYYFNGGSGQTLTFPSTVGCSSYFIVKNGGTGSLTIGITGSDKLMALNSTVLVSSLIILAGGQATFMSNGGYVWVQIS